MLDDQDMHSLAPSPSHHAVSREMSDADNNVFEDVGACTPPVSPRSGPMPGIILTVEGEVDSSPDVASVVGRQTRSKTRQSRRVQHAARSPSSGRMATQNGHHKLREPIYLSGSGVSRSQSMRTARRPQSVDPTHRFRQRIQSIPNEMIAPADGFNGQRLASNQSLPLPGDETDFTRLRNFAVTSKGLVNRGDSFRSKSRSTHSVVSIGGSGQLPVDTKQKPKDDSAINYPSVSASKTDAVVPEMMKDEVVEGATAMPETQKSNRYKVLVLGAPDVGKTALTNQFMTSEYKCAYENSQDEENERSVGVILNGSESELIFFEYQFDGDTNKNFTESFNPDAYLVVYSITSKRSLQSAKEVLRLIQKWDNVDMKALILVGNKTDLARHRVLSTDDGRSLAIEEGSKFIETSAGINHHVDELLVGILSQIRLKLSSHQRTLQKRESVSLGSGAGGTKVRGSKCSGCAGCRAKGLLKRLLKKACSKSKSCDNLLVL